MPASVTEALPDPPAGTDRFLDVAGVHVSTDPLRWTPLKICEVVRLLLRPANALQYQLRRGELGPDYHLAARGTLFLSDVDGFFWWKFWVEDLKVFDHTIPAYQVLATPASDPKIYQGNSITRASA